MKLHISSTRTWIYFSVTMSFERESMYKENIRRESIESSKNNLSVRTSTINSKLSHSTYVETERYHLNCPQILNQCSRVIFIFEAVVVFCSKDWWAAEAMISFYFIVSFELSTTINVSKKCEIQSITADEKCSISRYFK